MHGHRILEQILTYSTLISFIALVRIELEFLEQSLFYFLTRKNLIYISLLQRTNKYGGKKCRKCTTYLIDIATQLEYARYDLRYVNESVKCRKEIKIYVC